MKTVEKLAYWMDFLSMGGYLTSSFEDLFELLYEPGCSNF